MPVYDANMPPAVRDALTKATNTAFNNQVTAFNPANYLPAGSALPDTYSADYLANQKPRTDPLAVQAANTNQVPTAQTVTQPLANQLQTLPQQYTPTAPQTQQSAAPQTPQAQQPTVNVNTAPLPTSPSYRTSSDMMNQAQQDTGITQAAYQPQYRDQVLQLLNNIPSYSPQYRQQVLDVMNNAFGTPFSYNPETDLSLKQAQQQAQASTMEAMNSRGILNSTVTADRAAQATSQLVPQYETIAYQRYNDNLNNQLKRADILNSLDQQDLQAHIQNVQQIMQKTDVLNSMDQQDLTTWRENISLLYNRYNQINQDNINQINEWEAKVTKAQERVNQLGYVDNASSVVLGLPAGTLAKEARQRIEDYNNSLSAAKYQYDLDMQRTQQQWAREDQLLYNEEQKKSTEKQTQQTQSNNLAVVAAQLAQMTPDEALNYINQNKDTLAQYVGGELINPLITQLLARKQDQEANQAQYLGTYQGQQTMQGKQAEAQTEGIKVNTENQKIANKIAQIDLKNYDQKANLEIQNLQAALKTTNLDNALKKVQFDYLPAQLQQELIATKLTNDMNKIGLNWLPKEKQANYDAMMQSLEAGNVDKAMKQIQLDNLPKEYQLKFEGASLANQISKIQLDTLPEQQKLELQKLQQDLVTGDIQQAISKVQLSKLPEQLQTQIDQIRNGIALDNQKMAEEIRQNNIQADQWMKNYSLQSLETKLADARAWGQISIQQQNLALDKAKLAADQDPNSLDNQYKQAQIKALGTKDNSAEVKGYQDVINNTFMNKDTITGTTSIDKVELVKYLKQLELNGVDTNTVDQLATQYGIPTPESLGNSNTSTASNSEVPSSYSPGMNRPNTNTFKPMLNK